MLLCRAAVTRAYSRCADDVQCSSHDKSHVIVVKEISFPFACNPPPLSPDISPVMLLSSTTHVLLLHASQY